MELAVSLHAGVDDHVDDYGYDTSNCTRQGHHVMRNQELDNQDIQKSDALEKHTNNEATLAVHYNHDDDTKHLDL